MLRTRRGYGGRGCSERCETRNGVALSPEKTPPRQRDLTWGMGHTRNPHVEEERMNRRSLPQNPATLQQTIDPADAPMQAA